MALVAHCLLCQPVQLPGLTIDGPPTHCYGTGDEPAPPDVLGGFICDCDCRKRTPPPEWRPL